MPSHALTTIPQTYADLLRGVRAVLVTGQRKVDRTKLETYLQTGRLVHDHLQLHADQTGYGTQTIRRLARDLDFEESLLYRCLRFARVYPNFAGRRNLLWAHYRVLIDVEDPAERRALELEADRNRWTSEKLEMRVRTLNAVDVTPAKGDSGTNPATSPKPLTSKRGTVGVCRVVASGGGLAVDLGFTSYVDLPATTKLREGSFVRWGADGEFAAANDASKSDLYTYRAEALRVVDGDTLWMKVYLRPDLWVKEKLRLRGLDCPEIATPEGQAAKRFVETLVAKATGVIIATTKPDKWDRYLSDVFLAVPSDLSAKASATAEASAKEGDGSNREVFLNNHLLANGHARRMDEYALTDWDG